MLVIRKTASRSFASLRSLQRHERHQDQTSWGEQCTFPGKTLPSLKDTYIPYIFGELPGGMTVHLAIITCIDTIQFIIGADAIVVVRGSSFGSEFKGQKQERTLQHREHLS